MPNESSVLPQAFVTHRMQGRVRIRVPAMRNQAAYFENLRQRLATLPGLRRLTTNTRTGSVLIEHTGEIGELEALGQKLELFQLAPRQQPYSLSDYLYAATGKPDAFLKNVTDGRVDVAGLTAVALCGLAVRQVVAGHALPAGWTLLRDAVNIMKDASKAGKSG